MGLNPFFCSELSRGVAEKTFGTASIGQVWILLEYPFAWGSHALNDSNLSLPVKRNLKRTLRSIPHAKLLFIKQERARLSHRSLFVVRCRESKPFIQRFTLDDYSQLTEIDLAAVASGKLSTDENIFSDPLFLVCTHGRRDKCCAKFGYPLYKTLRESTRQSVWQSSHVGGDRFAGNLVCLPEGLYFGRVGPGDAWRVLDEYLAGRIDLERYRGRSCYPFAVQAGELAVRRATGLRGVDDVELVSRRPLRFGAGGRVVEVEVTPVPAPPTHLTCDAQTLRQPLRFAARILRESAA